MIAPPSSGESGQIPADLQRLDRERLEQLASELGTEGLAWLAVAPTWTQEIARAASFPTGSLDLAAWLKRAEDAALVEQEPERRADPKLGREFWIVEADRSPVLDLLKAPDRLGDHGLRKVTAQVARRLQYTSGGPELPVALDRWAALASAAEQPAAAAQRLESEVEQLTRDHRLGEARAAVTAGDALARIVGGPHLGSAVDLGHRRLDLAYREAGDQRYLRRYFKRADQERAFEAILDERSPAWALHYLGMGGIGKTMLLRRITSQIARERELAISRIDFDQQSPDYPVRKPGNLLLALALELRPHVGVDGERLVKQLADATEELHEQLGAEPPPDDPLFNVKRPEFGRLLNAFADLLRSVPRRVVLLLDTCEELARVPVVNQILPAVEATFEILARVHDEVPQVRVVLAGRRPLAASGHGWSLRDLDPGASWDRTHGLRPYLPARPFLALHEILGFSGAEAHDFLTESWALRLEREGPLERAVLERSIEAGRAVAFVRSAHEFTGFESRPPDADRADEPLYSPFDLSLHASWLTEDPSLGPDQIATADGDPYVEIRIVQRIQPIQLRAALPAIVALGRIDEQTLGEALPAGLPLEVVSDLYRALADHEWMEQQRDPHTGQLFLEVEPHLLPRLRKYYAHELRAPVADAARRRIVPGLERAVRTSPLGELSVHQIDAALGLLPAADAAELWTEILVRVPVEADWNWLRNVTERLLGGDGALSRQPSLAAGLTVASTSLQLHLAGATRATSDAELVMMARWPDERTRSWIERLHRLGSIDSGLPADQAAGALVDLLRGFEAVPATAVEDRPSAARLRSESEAGALMSTIEGRADRVSLAEPEPGVDWAPLAETLTAWADVLAAHAYPVTLVAMAEVVAARMNAAADRPDEAALLVERALETVTGERSGPDRPWLFWRHPDSVIDRVRLEALTLHRDHLVGPPPDPQRWLLGSGALSRTDTIDGERLASAIEQWQLDRMVPEPLELGVAEVAESYAVERQPVVAVHRHTPPLFVTLAKKRAAIGDFAAADQRLRDRAIEAAASRQDAETVRAATLARLEIARASRVVPADLPAAVRGLEAGLRERSEARPVLALRALTGVDLTEGFRALSSEPWMSAQAPPDPPRPANSSTPPGPTPISTAPRPVQAKGVGESKEEIGSAMERRHFEIRKIERVPHSLDGVLRAMLCAYALSHEPVSVSRAVADTIARLLGPADRPDPTTMLAAANALAEFVASRDAQPPSLFTGPEPGGGPARLLHIVGARRLAAIAQDEGELLALWLPEEGARLLALAADLAAYGADDVTRLHAEITAGLALARLGRQGTPLDPWVRDEWTRITGDAPPSLEDVERWWNERRLELREQEDGLSGWRVRHGTLVALGTDPAARARLAGSRSAWQQSFVDAAARTPELAFVFGATLEQTAESASPPPPAPSGRLPIRPSTLDQVLAVGVMGISFGLLLYLVGSGALVFPASSRVGGEPGLGVVALVIAGLSAAMVLLRTWRPNLGDTAIGGAALLIGFSLYYAVIGALIDWAFATTLGRWERFALMLLLLAALGAIPSATQRLWSRWRSRVARRSELAVGIASSIAPNLRQADTRTEVTITFAMERVRTAGWRLPVREPRRSWSKVVELPTVLRGFYEDASASIDADTVASVAAIRADLGGVEWAVPLLIDRAHQLPWEALLSRALTAAAGPDDSVFFYRAEPGTDFDRRQGGLARGVVSVMGSHPEAVGVWQNAGWTLGDETGQSLVVHAVGTPILGSAGPQFRLADRGPSAREAMLETPAAKSAPGFGAVSDLAPRSLLILQQEPAFSNARLGSDREQAALLRAVAADLFQRGHLAVVTIPSFNPELADTVLSAIARRLREKPSLLSVVAAGIDFSTARRREPDEFRCLVHAVRDARRAVHAWLAKNGNALEAALDDRTEAAWDVCLFARYPERPLTGAATSRMS